MQVRTNFENVYIVTLIGRVNFRAILVFVDYLIKGDHAFGCLECGARFCHCFLVHVHRLIDDYVIVRSNIVGPLVGEDVPLVC